MFVSISGHSSELSIANHSSRPKISQLKCVSDTKVYLRITNQRRQKTSTVIYAPFIQNSNRITSRLTATTSFPKVFFQLLQFSRQRPSFSAHRAALMTKNFSSIFFKICRFRSSILLSMYTSCVETSKLCFTL